jgi:hypothetical protein
MTALGSDAGGARATGIGPPGLSEHPEHAFDP